MTSVMVTLKVIVAIIILFIIAYMIIKVLAHKEQHQIVITPEQPKKIVTKMVEIKSKDLYMVAENLIATHDVYALQTDEIAENINKIENILDRWRKFNKYYGELKADEVIRESLEIVSDDEAKLLMSKSLKLQEQKCKIEAKMLRIMKQLDNIAEEEYRRQAGLKDKR